MKHPDVGDCNDNGCSSDRRGWKVVTNQHFEGELARRSCREEADEGRLFTAAEPTANVNRSREERGTPLCQTLAPSLAEAATQEERERKREMERECAAAN